MNQAQYIAQNALGFEGDTHLRESFNILIKAHKITLVIETGTYRGATTKALAEMAKKVITIESNMENYRAAQEILAEKANVEMLLGSSANLLKFAINRIVAKDKVLFFLDAHWGDNNPLLKELETIQISGLKPIIIIHDFKVPAHPELGYDTYGDIVYQWEYIKEHIEGIFGAGKYTVEYNNVATGAKRGVIFISPK